MGGVLSSTNDDISIAIDAHASCALLSLRAVGILALTQPFCGAQQVGQARAASLPFRWFFPPRLRVGRCCVRTALALRRDGGGERACNTALSDRDRRSSAAPPAAPSLLRAWKEKAKQLHRGEKEKRSLFLWQPTDGPPCSTAARNSRRRRAPLRGRSALDARSSLSRRGSSPSCHSTPPGLPRWFRERQARPAAEMAKVVVVFVGPLVARLSAAAWWACWIERSAWVDALPTSCMVSCRYVVVFA